MTEFRIQLSDEATRRLRARAEATGRAIEEMAADALEALYGAPSIFSVEPRRDEMLREVAAFEAQREALVEAFEGEHIAMSGGTVIDHDAALPVLVARVRTSHAEAVVLFRHVSREARPPLRVTSLRHRRWGAGQ